MAVCQNLVPLFCSHQNSWVKMDVHSPKNDIFIGIDPYPYSLPQCPWLCTSWSHWAPVREIGNSTWPPTAAAPGGKRPKFHGKPRWGYTLW